MPIGGPIFLGKGLLITAPFIGLLTVLRFGSRNSKVELLCSIRHEDEFKRKTSHLTYSKPDFQTDMEFFGHVKYMYS